MSVEFLTPAAALVGLVVLLALAMLARAERRSRETCAALGLLPRRRRSAAVDALALASIGVLLALAAAQPVVSSTQEGRGRTDAEVVVVVDVSRSMLAARGASPSRLDRARSLAKELRAELPEIRVGVASLTDRVLPHLFPSLTQNTFVSTIDRAIGIERPPPDRRTRRATALGALQDVARSNYFSAGTRRRIAVVFTDGETVPVGLGTFRARFLQGGTALFLVHVWDPDERIRAPGGALEPYRPDPTSREALEQIASAVDGAVFDERRLPETVDEVRRLLGDGPTAPQGRELRPVELGQYVVGAAFAPLLVLLRRRNL